MEQGEVTLDRLLKTFTPTQLDFVAARMTAHNDKEAAEAIGVSPDVVYAWHNKQDVNEAVRLAKLDGVTVAHEKLKRLATNAVEAVGDIVNDRKGSKRLDAALAVLNRVGMPEVKRQEIDTPAGGTLDALAKRFDDALATIYGDGK